MLTRIRQFVAPPVFADEEKTRIAALANFSLWSGIVIVVVITGVVLVTGDVAAAQLLGGVLAIFVIALGLLRRGRLGLARWLIPLTVLAAAAFRMVVDRGAHDIAILALPVAIAMAGLLLGQRAAALFGAGAALIFGWVNYAEAARLLVTELSAFAEIDDSFIGGALLLLSAALSYVLIESLSASLARARSNEQALRALAANLEQRVADRTRDMTLAVEAGQILAQERDLDRLLNQAVELIRARFGLYHVQVYLTDPAGQLLILRAGTGLAGQELLRRRHRLPVDLNSINGAAVVNRRSLLVADTRASAAFRPNPLLPETRSELAVPLLSGERVLGVLDLQSASAEGLSAENEPAFVVLAGQLAVAVENSNLFAQLEQARLEVESQTRRLSGQGWSDFLDAIQRNEQLERAVVRLPELETAASVLSAPVTVAGETIGALRVEDEAGRAWTAEEAELVSVVARQVAQQVENLRLLAQAEQYRGEAERALRRLTREGWRDYLEVVQLQPAYAYVDGQVTAAADPAPAGPLVAEPLVVQGEPVGEIGVEAEDLPPEGEALVAAVAAQLSAHIENLRLGEATQLALAETEELYRITAQLNAAPAMPDVIGVLAGLNAATAGGLFLLEPDAAGRPAGLVYTAGWPQPNPRLGPLGTRLPVETFPETAYWREHPQEPLLVGDLEADARVQAATRALYRQLGVRAAAFLPLGLAGRWTGLVTLSWLQPRVFSTRDQQVYRAAAAQAAVVINNRVLYEQTRKRADREAVINAITQKIQGTATVEGALETAIQELGQALQARRASVALAAGAAEAPAGNGQHLAAAETAQR